MDWERKTLRRTADKANLDEAAHLVILTICLNMLDEEKESDEDKCEIDLGRKMKISGGDKR